MQHRRFNGAILTSLGVITTSINRWLFGPHSPRIDDREQQDRGTIDRAAKVWGKLGGRKGVSCIVAWLWPG
jgi:hypothetical protein